MSEIAQDVIKLLVGFGIVLPSVAGFIEVRERGLSLHSDSRWSAFWRGYWIALIALAVLWLIVIGLYFAGVR